MTVSERLTRDYGVQLRPGAKGTCPFCGNDSLSLKRDDSLAKCFHPGCGRWIGTHGDQQHPTMAAAMEMLYQDWHRVLLDLKEARYQSAYHYLADERKIHPQVIHDAPLGALPSGGYDLTRPFQPWLMWLREQQEKPEPRGRPKKGTTKDEAAQRYADAIAMQERLAGLIAGRAGWLVFFYMDQAHRIVSLKFRQPYTKHFVTFKPYKTVQGLFGHGMFHPSSHPDEAQWNRRIIVTEGEFNVLQLQSASIRALSPDGQAIGYVYACAVGGVQGTDITCLSRLNGTPQPLVVYDHDRHQAGFELVTRLRTAMAVEACTTPSIDSDLDQWLLTFHTDYRRAWDAWKALIRTRERYPRHYSGTGIEFFSGPAFIPRRLAQGLMEADAYATIDDMLWVYRDGVYRPHGEAYASTQIQQYLGETWRKARAADTIAYLIDATRVTAATTSLTHVNCRNGRVAWQSGTIEPHDPTVIEILQFPLRYDPQATCPQFDHYLNTTLDAELHPLVEEIMGYCLVPDTRFEKAIMLTGAGANGKSVLLNVLASLLGDDHVCHVAWQELEEHRFALAQLYGKLANLFADVDSRALRSASMFKQLVAGDPLLAERKFGGQFTFRPYATLIFSANRMPVSQDRSYGFFRRLIVVPFERTFSGTDADRELIVKLRGELPGIFNRALSGLQRLYDQQGFSVSTKSLAATRAYEHDVDSVAAFMGEVAIESPTAYIAKQVLYDAYRHWCEAQGLRSVSQKELRSSLYRLIPTVQELRFPTNRSPWHWVGVGLPEEIDG